MRSSLAVGPGAAGKAGAYVHARAFMKVTVPAGLSGEDLHLLLTSMCVIITEAELLLPLMYY